jgi:hypothetical protein
MQAASKEEFEFRVGAAASVAAAVGWCEVGDVVAAAVCARAKVVGDWRVGRVGERLPADVTGHAES